MLTDGEVDSARFDAQQYVKERRIELHLDPEFLDRAIQRQIVLRAFVDADSDPDAPKPFFDSIDDIKDLDAALVLQLFHLYCGHQQAMEPLAHLSEEEVEELVAVLGKSGSSERLMGLDRPSLLSCVLSMACVLRTMQRSSK
jgi:hypothetical protein